MVKIRKEQRLAFEQAAHAIAAEAAVEWQGRAVKKGGRALPAAREAFVKAKLVEQFSALEKQHKLALLDKDALSSALAHCVLQQLQAKASQKQMDVAVTLKMRQLLDTQELVSAIEIYGGVALNDIRKMTPSGGPLSIDGKVLPLDDFVELLIQSMKEGDLRKFLTAKREAVVRTVLQQALSEINEMLRKNPQHDIKSLSDVEWKALFREGLTTGIQYHLNQR